MASDSKANIYKASAAIPYYGNALKRYVCACKAESSALTTNHRLSRANIFSLARPNGNTFTDRPFSVFDERCGGTNRQAQPRVTLSIADFRVTSITTCTLPADSAPGAACSAPPMLLPEDRSARVSHVFLVPGCNIGVGASQRAPRTPPPVGENTQAVFGLGRQVSDDDIISASIAT